MGKIKVSAMPTATALTGSEIAMVLQNGQNKKATLTQILSINATALIVEKNISSNEILDIHNTGIQVLANSGVGYYYKYIGMDVKLIHNGITYTVTGTPTLALCYNGNASRQAHNTFQAIVTSSVTSIAPITQLTSLTGYPISDIEDASLVLRTTVSAANFYSTGNGTLRLRLLYQIVQI